MLFSFNENSNPKELTKSIQNLVELIKAENLEVLQVFNDWFAQYHDLGKKNITNLKIQKHTEVSGMYANALKKYEKEISISARQSILIDQLEIKFGRSVSDRKKILSQTTAGKLDKALQTILSAKIKDEVLKHLD
jgi:membrane-bound lytic murein transglycosylase B